MNATGVHLTASDLIYCAGKQRNNASANLYSERKDVKSRQGDCENTEETQFPL